MKKADRHPRATKRPRKPSEWRSAVDAAKGSLALASAQRFGFIALAAKIDEDRCRAVLKEGKQLGYIPTGDGFELFVSKLAKHL